MSDKPARAIGFFSAVFLSLSIIIAGWFISYGLVYHGSYNDFVTVKGLAMQNVEADLVVWPIRHVATGNDLPAVQQQIENNTQKITAFLRAQGIGDSETGAI